LFLARACNLLREKYVDGKTAMADHAKGIVMNSVGLVTQLNPILGYSTSSGIAKEAIQSGKSVYHIVFKERKLIIQKKWDEVYSVNNLITPKYID
jgi:aspartate ammonia-lyase